MSVNIAINESWDIAVVNGVIQRSFDTTQVRQLIETRLLLVRQEWFLDLNAGLPWYTEMTGRNVNPFTVRSYISNEIVNTPGVESLQSLEMDYDSAARKLNLVYVYTDVFGEQVTGNL